MPAVTISSPAVTPASTSSQLPSSTPIWISRRSTLSPIEHEDVVLAIGDLHGARGDDGHVRVDVLTIAPRPYMPGRSSPASFSSCTSASSVRVAGSSAGARRTTLPCSDLPGSASSSTCASLPDADAGDLALGDRDEDAQHVDAHDGHDRAAARRRADERARVEPAHGDDAVERRLDARLAEPRREAADLRLAPLLRGLRGGERRSLHSGALAARRRRSARASARARGSRARAARRPASARACRAPSTS